MVPSQRGHECRWAAGRDAGALFMSKDGLHGLRADRSRCAAGLVAAHEPAAVVIGPLRRSFTYPFSGANGKTFARCEFFRFWTQSRH